MRVAAAHRSTWDRLRILLIRGVSCALLAVAAGCADLAAIRSFSQISADSAGYGKLVQEYADSADVKRIYLTPELRGRNEEQRLDAEAADRASQAQGLIAVLQVLQAYMKALGDLAADGPADYSSNVQGLTGAIEKASIIDADTAKAAGSVISLVLKIATDGYRQRELRRAIDEADPHVQAMARTMTAGIKPALALSLRGEETAIRRYLSYWERHHAAKEPVAFETMRFNLAERLADYPARRRAAERYFDAITAIAQGHAKLREHQERLDSKLLLATIRQYRDQIEAAMNDVRNARK